MSAQLTAPPAAGGDAAAAVSERRPDHARRAAPRRRPAGGSDEPPGTSRSLCGRGLVFRGLGVFVLFPLACDGWLTDAAPRTRGDHHRSNRLWFAGVYQM